MRAASIAALALAPMAVPASASSTPSAVEAEIDCRSGYVCIYPEINFVRPALGAACCGRQREGPALRDP
jgi:hypothetical protein